MFSNESKTTCQYDKQHSLFMVIKNDVFLLNDATDMITENDLTAIL